MYEQNVSIRLWFMTYSIEHKTATHDPAIKIDKWEGMLPSNSSKQKHKFRKYRNLNDIRVIQRVVPSHKQDDKISPDK